MAKSKKSKYQFEIVPVVPEDLDFDGAVGICNQAVAAIRYWQDMKRAHSNWTEEYHTAFNMLPRWQQVHATAQKVVASFQMRLF